MEVSVLEFGYFSCLTRMRVKMKVKPVHGPSSIWKSKPPSGHTRRFDYYKFHMEVLLKCSMYFCQNSYTHFHMEVNITILLG